MDDFLPDLESELKRLTPRRPSAGLMQALERELGPVPVAAHAPGSSSAPSLRSLQWATWALAGMAAAIAVVVEFNRKAASPAPAAAIASAAQPEALQTVAAPLNRYQPVHASTILYDLQEDGATTLPDRTEGRQVRYRYVDTYTWKNPATNASLRWSVPRDEVRLVRASLD